MLDLHCWAGFSLLAADRGYSQLMVCGLLIEVASFVAGLRISGARVSVAVAPGLQSAGSGAVVHRLGGSTARGIVPDQGLNPRLLHWQVDSLPLSQQGSSKAYSIFFFNEGQ